MCDSARGYFAAMSAQLAHLNHELIDAYATMIFEAWRERRAVFVFGNGGSAFTASHHVCDYVKTAAVPDHPRLKAFSLVDNTGMTTAIGNDIGYEDTFVHILESYAAPGDLAVAISCSGNSPNVVRAAEWAIANGLTLVALTGFGGGKIAHMADLHINVPSENYGVVEDLHMSIGHVAAQALHQQIIELQNE